MVIGLHKTKQMDLIKKILVQTDLPSKKGQFLFIVGRFQPMTDSEKQIIYAQLLDGNKVCIGVLDGETDATYNETTLEVIGRLMEEFDDFVTLKQIFIMAIPNITALMVQPKSPVSIHEFKYSNL